MREIAAGKIFLPVFMLVLGVSLWFFSACSLKSQPHVKIESGQTRQTIIRLIGNPQEKRMATKRSKNVWGPEEEFWDRIPMGAHLEIWQYQFSDGRLTLYFVDGSDTLDFKAFHPDGVVY